MERKISTPRGARHRRLRQLQWWPLSELPTAPAGGPPSTSSSTTMVAAAGAPDSTPRGPAIDVFINYDGGRCRSSRQHPQGARHRRLHQLRWWPLPELPTAPLGGLPSTSSSTTMVAAAGAPGSTPRGPAIDAWLKTWYLSLAFLLRDTYQGATMANTTTAGKPKFRGKIFLEKG
jgi:hypothetical protein